MARQALPAKGDLDGSTVSHNQGLFKAAAGAVRDFLAQFFGTDGLIDTAINAMRITEPGQIHNLKLEFSVGSSALTATVKTRAGATPSADDPVLVCMRSATAGSGDHTLRKITAALSLTISSGSTLGRSLASIKGYLFWYLLDNGGALDLAVSGKFFGASGIVSSTAEGGAGGADSSTVMYSATARTNVAFVCIGMSIDTQGTPGTWAAAPTDVRLGRFSIPECAFRAHRNGTNQTAVANDTWTKFQGTAESFDIGGEYDTSAFRFVASMPGVYNLGGNALTLNPLNPMAVFASIYVNGSPKASAYNRTVTNGGNDGAVISTTLFLNTHDYVEFYIYHSRGTTEDFYGAEQLTAFYGNRAGTGAA